MVVDLNFHRVKKNFLLIIFLLFSTNSYSQDYNFKKITKLEEPWGSSFINNNELIISEKGGKIKIVKIENGNTNEIDHNLNFLDE